MNETFGKKKLKPVIFVVLGPHRSGTSALTGVLSQLGANLPKHLMPANDGNAVGYFESSRVKAFNDRLLSEIGSSWDDISALDLASVPDQIRESFLDEAVEILKAEFVDARIPVLKDPRICRLVDFWREAIDRFGYRPIYIHTHRNPLETACSLVARHPISVEMGVLIWLRHVLDAEAATRNEPRAFTNYQALLGNWRTQVSKIETATGFSFHRKTPAIQQEIDTFLSENLRHQIHQPEDMRRSAQVADLVCKAFDIFEGWADGISDLADHHRLDILRTRLDGSIGVIRPFVQMLKRDNAKRKSLEVRFDELEQGTAQIEIERSRLSAELDQLRKDGARQDGEQAAKIAELEQGTAQIKAERSQLAAELDRLREDGARKDGEQAARIVELEQGTAQIEAERSRLAAELDRLHKDDARRDGEQAARIAKLEQGTAEIEAERSRLAAELDRLHEDGACRDANHIAQLSDLKGELHQRSLEAEQWFDTNHQLKNKIETLQTENLLLAEQAKAEQHRFEIEIRSRDDAIGALKGSVKERFNEIARISEMLIRVSKQLDEERTRRAELEQRSAQVESELKESFNTLQQEAKNSGERVNDLLASTSWQITAPLRRLASSIRRWR